MSWSAVYASVQPHLIEIVKNILKDHSIECVTVDKRDSMYVSMIDPAIEIHVPSTDVITAKKLIADFENQ